MRILGIGFLSDLFLLIVFPTILFQLKRLIEREYNYSLGFKFNIIIIVVFISKALPLLGSIILSTFVDFSAFSGTQSGNYTSVPSNVPYTELVMGFAYMIELLTIIRGVALIILAMLLLKKINDFRKTMKIAIISMLILGIHTFLIGAIQLLYIAGTIYSNNNNYYKDTSIFFACNFYFLIWKLIFGV